MEKTKQKQTKKVEKNEVSCDDKFCPIHGSMPLKMRGRTFEGAVIKKLHGRLTIEFERPIYSRKYERYEKRKTKLHARLPKCMEDSIELGDWIKIAETRPVSKMIHFVVMRVIRKSKEAEK